MTSRDDIEHKKSATGITQKQSWPVRVFMFYRDGFREMTVGKKLWAIILIKLFVMFAIIKVLFFPNLLKRDYKTDDERSGAVRTSLLDRGINATDSLDSPEFPMSSQ